MGQRGSPRREHCGRSRAHPRGRARDCCAPSTGTSVIPGRSRRGQPVGPVDRPRSSSTAACSAGSSPTAGPAGPCRPSTGPRPGSAHEPSSSRQESRRPPRPRRSDQLWRQKGRSHLDRCIATFVSELTEQQRRQVSQRECHGVERIERPDRPSPGRGYVIQRIADDPERQRQISLVIRTDRRLDDLRLSLGLRRRVSEIPARAFGLPRLVGHALSMTLEPPQCPMKRLLWGQRSSRRTMATLSTSATDPRTDFQCHPRAYHSVSPNLAFDAHRMSRL